MERMPTHAHIYTHKHTHAHPSIHAFSSHLDVSHGRHPSHLVHGPEVHVNTLGAETQGPVHRQAVNAHEAPLIHARPDVAVVRQLRVTVGTPMCVCVCRELCVGIVRVLSVALLCVTYVFCDVHCACKCACVMWCGASCCVCRFSN